MCGWEPDKTEGWIQFHFFLPPPFLQLLCSSRITCYMQVVGQVMSSCYIRFYIDCRGKENWGKTPVRGDGDENVWEKLTILSCLLAFKQSPVVRVGLRWYYMVVIIIITIKTSPQTVQLVCLWSWQDVPWPWRSPCKDFRPPNLKTWPEGTRKEEVLFWNTEANWRLKWKLAGSLLLRLEQD